MLNNQELVNRIASALMKADMYERVSGSFILKNNYCVILINFSTITSYGHNL